MCVCWLSKVPHTWNCEDIGKSGVLQLQAQIHSWLVWIEFLFGLHHRTQTMVKFWGGWGLEREVGLKGTPLWRTSKTDKKGQKRDACTLYAEMHMAPMWIIKLHVHAVFKARKLPHTLKFDIQRAHTLPASSQSCTHANCLMPLCTNTLRETLLHALHLRVRHTCVTWHLTKSVALLHPCTHDT